MHICDICEYKTDRQLNYAKHLETKKHKVNVILASKKSDMLIKQNPCDYCKINFKNDKSLIKHIKLCLKNPNNKLCQYCNQVFNKENNYLNHIEICTQNKILELENKIEEMKKYSLNNSNRTNNSITTYNCLNLYFNDAPEIKQIDNFNIYNKKALNADGQLKFLDELIYYNEHKMLPKFIGDHIIKIYKKDNIEDQSVWNSDTARLNYMIKKAFENGWCADKKGTKFVKIGIEPLLKFIESDVNEQIRLLAIKSRDGNLSNIQSYAMNKKCEKLNEVITKIQSSKLSNEILIYISPHFHINKKFIETYKKNGKTKSLENSKNLLLLGYDESELIEADELDELELVDSDNDDNLENNKNLFLKLVHLDESELVHSDESELVNSDESELVHSDESELVNSDDDNNETEIIIPKILPKSIPTKKIRGK